MKGRIALMSGRLIEAVTLQKIQLSGGSQGIGSDSMAAHQLTSPRSETEYNRRNRKPTQVDEKSPEVLPSGSRSALGVRR